MTIEELTLIVSLIGIVLSAFSLGYRVGRGSKKRPPRTRTLAVIFANRKGQPSLVTLFPFSV